MGLKPGDKVRVREWSEIRRTLDERRCCDGLLFCTEMEEYCGKENTILKKVHKIIDYYNKGVRTFKKTYILDKVICKGNKDYPECDRMCFFFWKEQWLEKIFK